MIKTHTCIQQPLWVEFDGVKRIHRSGFGAVFGGFWQYHFMQPWIVRRWIVQISTHIVASCAYTSFTSGAAFLNRSTLYIRFLVSQFQAHVIAVFQRTCVKLACQIGHVLVGSCVTHACIATTPYHAVLYVAFAVVRLSPYIVLARACSAEDIAQFHVFVEIVLKRHCALIGFFFAEIAVVHTVPVFTAVAISRAVNVFT